MDMTDFVRSNFFITHDYCVIREILVETRELIHNRDRWIKGRLATDIDGNSVPTYSDKAVCFCLLGAILKAKQILRVVEYSDRTESFITEYLKPKYIGIGPFNDKSTHEEVINLLNKLIVP